MTAQKYVIAGKQRRYVHLDSLRSRKNNIKRYRKIFKLIYNVIVKFCTSMIVEHITGQFLKHPFKSFSSSSKTNH